MYDLQVLSDGICWSAPPAPQIMVGAYIDDGTCQADNLISHLSDDEKFSASKLKDPDERRHFILRRCFQRVFLKTAVGWQGSIPGLRIVHGVDVQPYLPDMPQLRLSFSSSGKTSLACVAWKHRVGIDIEKIRTIGNTNALAQRFFASDEARWLSGLPPEEQNLAFFKLWAAKEASLKAIGKGIISGLNNFRISHKNRDYAIEMAEESTFPNSWTLQYLEFVPSHIVALVHSPDNTSTDSL